MAATFTAHYVINVGALEVHSRKPQGKPWETPRPGCSPSGPGHWHTMPQAGTQMDTLDLRGARGERHWDFPAA